MDQEAPDHAISRVVGAGPDDDHVDVVLARAGPRTHRGDGGRAATAAALGAGGPRAAPGLRLRGRLLELGQWPPRLGARLLDRAAGRLSSLGARLLVP